MRPIASQTHHSGLESSRSFGLGHRDIARRLHIVTGCGRWPIAVVLPGLQPIPSMEGSIPVRRHFAGIARAAMAVQPRSRFISKMSNLSFSEARISSSRRSMMPLIR